MTTVIQAGTENYDILNNVRKQKGRLKAFLFYDIIKIYF